MQILYLDEVDSTQKYLKKLLQTGKLQAPCAVSAEKQTNGIGSRDNEWSGLEGNVFLSFALPLSVLPKDLKLESASIYFAYLLKETLYENGSKVFLKWPNDFYIKDKKIGGLITHLVDKTIVCGVGINLIKAPLGFEKLDIVIDKKILLNNYLEKTEKKISWKKVFSKYKLEFHCNQKFFTHVGQDKISLDGVGLEEDGSLRINGKRVYSLR